MLWERWRAANILQLKTEYLAGGRWVGGISPCRWMELKPHLDDINTNPDSQGKRNKRRTHLKEGQSRKRLHPKTDIHLVRESNELLTLKGSWLSLSHISRSFLWPLSHDQSLSQEEDFYAVIYLKVFYHNIRQHRSLGWPVINCISFIIAILGDCFESV